MNQTENRVTMSQKRLESGVGIYFRRVGLCGGSLAGVYTNHGTG